MEDNTPGLGAKLLAIPAVMAIAIVGFVQAAGAQAATTEETVESGFSDLQSLFTGTIAVALFALVIAIIGVVMGVKWLRKTASA